MADIARIKRNIGSMIDQGAPEEDIDAYLSSEGVTIEQLKATALPPTEEEQTARMYEGRARHMREKSPTMTAVRDKLTALIEGTPIGSWFDESMAGLSSFVNGPSYKDAKGLLDADRRIREAESVKLGTLPVVGDVTVNGLTKLSGGIATAALAPQATVFGRGAQAAGQALPLAARMGNAAVNGIGYGTAYGAGEGNTATERGNNAAIGGAMGGVIGAAMPALAQGAGNAVEALTRRTPVPQGLQQFDRAAIRRVVETMRMEGLPENEIRDRLRNLGAEGMLADVGENLTAVTEGLYQQPGQQKAIISDALNPRSNAALGRITGTLDAAMGHPTNVNLTIDNLRQQARQLAGPHYAQFHATRIPADNTLDIIVGRARRSIPGVFRKAMNLAVADGVNPRYLINLADDPMTRLTGVQGQHGRRVWQGVELDYLKRAIDDIARDAGRGTNEQRIYSNMARALRDHVDNLISPGNPAQSPWRQGRAIAGEEMGMREALQQGETLFTRRQDPIQTAADLSGMSQIEQEGYRLGARSNLRNTMGRAATNFGPSGDRAARRALNSEFNRGNVRELYGRQAADSVAARIDAENTMADTMQTVMGNSATSRRQAVRDLIPRQYEANNMKTLRGTSLTGLAAEGVGRIVNLLTSDALNARNTRIAADMARMLVANGARRRDVVNGLFQYMRDNQVSQQQREAITRIAQQVMQGSQAPAIGQATQ